MPAGWAIPVPPAGHGSELQRPVLQHLLRAAGRVLCPDPPVRKSPDIRGSGRGNSGKLRVPKDLCLAARVFACGAGTGGSDLLCAPGESVREMILLPFFMQFMPYLVQRPQNSIFTFSVAVFINFHILLLHITAMPCRTQQKMKVIRLKLITDG
jgi:hypothetical protein